MFTFQVLLLLLYAVATSVRAFTNVWPLGATTAAYDVIKMRQAVFPNTTQCVRIGSSNSFLGYKPIRLSGGSSSYIDVRVDDTFTADVTFALNFKAERLEGTLFDYRADSGRACTQPCFWRVTAQLTTNGAINVTMEGSLTPLTSRVTSNIRATAGKWAYLHVGFDVNKINAEVIFTPRHLEDSDVSEKLTFGSGDDHYTLATAGVLRFGASRSLENIFKGEVTCAAMKNEKTAAIEDLDDACTVDSSSPAPTCLKTTDAIQAFPFTNSGAGYDVIQNLDMRLPTSGHLLRVDSDVTALTSGSLVLDGSPLSTLDLRLTSASRLQDFAFAFSVKMDARFLGTLAHAQFPSDASGAMSAFEIEAWPDSIVAFVDSLGSSGVAVHSSFPISTSALAQGWQIVGLSRAAGTVTFVVGGNALTASLQLSTSLPGSLRVGGSFREGAEGLHGQVACVAVFDRALKSPADLQEEMREACRLGPVPPGAPIGASAIHSHHFKLLAGDKDVKDFQPITEFTVNSLNSCAKECRAVEHCRSFTLTRVEKQGKGRTCRLFDHATHDCLEQRNGNNYYIITN